MSESREQEFADFYHRSWRGTVSCAFGMTADLAAAEDVAQDAYSRAWARWRTVRTYDNPDAWVRLVATRLAVSRWRRIRTMLDHLERSAVPEPAPAPSENTLLLVSALRQLPSSLRRAVVLHHIGDLTVSQIAEIEECPEGTVKGRLSRGRAALAKVLETSHEVEGEATHA